MTATIIGRPRFGEQREGPIASREPCYAGRCIRGTTNVCRWGREGSLVRRSFLVHCALVGPAGGILLLIGSCGSNGGVLRYETATPPTAEILAGTATPPAWPSPAVFECQPTVPNGATPPGESPRAGQHGNGAIWTELPRDGRVVFRPGGPYTIGRDGMFSMKLGWWRSVPGDLRIEGRRINGSTTDRFSASVPDGYGRTGFQVSGVSFSSQGCWEITGRIGGESLTVVMAVVVSP
jgi:hypothetical protein